MTPWLVLVVLTAGLNLSLFVLARGRWDRLVLALALAALAGAAIGNALGEVTGLRLVRIGDFNFAAASLVSQAAMLATLLGTIVVQTRQPEEQPQE